MSQLLKNIVGSLRRQTHRGLSAGDRLLFPPRCTFCGADFELADEIVLCDECRKQLAPPTGPLCGQCGAPVPLLQSSVNAGCPHCLQHDWHFDKVIPLGAYRDALRDAVLRIKLAAEEPLAAALGRLWLLHRVRELAAVRADLIVPVPMHWLRRISRGVNNPEILADQLARGLGIRRPRRVLRRRRRTEKQGYLSRAKRAENMHGAFAVSSARGLDGARILLVDDILTTGVTCNEAAKILLAAGAASVSVAALARAASEH